MSIWRARAGLASLAILGASLALTPAMSPAMAKTVTLKFLVANVRPEEVAADVKAFQAEYPNIKVVPILEAWDTGTDKFVAMVAAGSTVDLIDSNAIANWPRYIRAGLFNDLTPLVQRDKQELNPADFTKLMLDNFTTKGRMYCIPGQQFLAQSIIYNATLLKEAGLSLPPYDWDSKDWDWDTMISYGQKLVAKTATGKVTRWGIDFWDVPMPYTWATGGDWFDQQSYATQEVNKITINTPENAKAYEKVWELRYKYKIQPAVGLGPSGIQAFWDGKLGMWLDPQQFVDPKRYKQSYQWGLAPFPSMMPGMNNTYAWNEAMAIPKSSKNVEAAWTFVKWITRRAGSTDLSIYHNSARKSGWARMLDNNDMSLCALTKSQMAKVIEGGLDHARAYPTMLYPFDQIATAVTPELDKYLVNNKAALQQTLERCQNVAVAELKKYVRKK